MTVEMTFDSLTTLLQAYSERGNATYDPTVAANIPGFINTTERRMAREMKVQGFENVVNSAMTAGLIAYQKPDRWRETISMSIGTGTSNNTQTFLREMSYEAGCTYWPDRSVRDVPRYYADYDYNHYAIFPIPDAAYPWEIVFWQLPPLLDSSNQTNWLTQYAPNALLHGCLVEMFGFLRNQGDMDKWKAEYDRDMAAIVGEDVQKIIDRYYRRNTS